MIHAIGLDIDTPVDISEGKGKIVIEPLHKLTYDLDDLLKGITRRNLHDPVDFG